MYGQVMGSCSLLILLLQEKKKLYKGVALYTNIDIFWSLELLFTNVEI